MEIVNLLEYNDRAQLREWFMANHATAKECWVTMYRTKIPRTDCLPYLDVVEEALCFGWIDSTVKRLPDGRCAQRLSPRRKGSHWTELKDKYNLWFEDSGHEVTTRKLVWCTEDYQDLWNGYHVRLYNGRIHIKNGSSTVSTKTAIRSAESMVMTSHSLTTADGNAFEAVM